MKREVNTFCEYMMKQSKAIPCVLMDVVEYDNEDGSETYLEIVEGNEHTGNCIGMHLQNPDQFELDDAIDSAIRDGFERIYVYGGVR